MKYISPIRKTSAWRREIPWSRTCTSARSSRPTMRGASPTSKTMPALGPFFTRIVGIAVEIIP
jgi:hypothetical protein